MVVGPNFGHSGVQESLLTQVPRKPRLITVLPLGGQKWQRCISLDLTHEGRSEEAINVGPQ